MLKEEFSLSEVADILGVSKETLRRWDTAGKLVSQRNDENNYRFYRKDQLKHFEQAQFLFKSQWSDESKTCNNIYTVLELFAGAGGMALGLEKAGLKSVLLNEIDSHACKTLRKNRPEWNVVEGDVSKVDFTPYRNTVDVLAGGFPCQAFSYAGKKLGFEDTRGTLFFEFARAVKEINPKVLLAENVRGLLNHDDGRTLDTIKSIITDLGYTLFEPRVLKAIFYKVPQKRERLIIVAVRNDLANGIDYEWPSSYNKILTLKDALKKGELYDSDVPESEGQKYPKRKAEILSMVPPGGYWRDLPEDIQKEYMLKSFYLGGGKTGMARRLSWDEPSLTLTCAPAQKQTERCHPEETRPLTVREYARIQTFPDDWVFEGPMSAKYKQIGNAVPVNLSFAVGKSVVHLLEKINKR
ncbi:MULTISPECIES: DNA (cytosine-5-)-methyltransferase [Enterobacteriaceae]|jgi:DNA (cytosine-5)-methyltransferase 1|uniref:DNA (cytosine-5-)-methyltransferase n=1 Tax=Enterobacteriaceae TaxID=543 RepID=UPI00051906AD|nr:MULTISPECIES: DNA (cytosine-5-)-methyltransferase [Enterobacteriaceae]EGT4253846.1 DNA (cytosine-5-)-methyltransferase [Citrobacter amalonaticus]ELY3435576.1 DNA (cytosine-5-)-methyltransferase [Cronobacter sakazakii]HAU5607401.1 DNA (cytosine-5-)-methyltransferase [Citrobacter koseri]HCJ7640502.1 DNA (cytosine-5-)-methyltransferase [Enterobacter hormaechei subsp. xiangfangensis]AOP85270.1 DNA (cytosine-5-)-methyltransferase [Enterobacter kobei]